MVFLSSVFLRTNSNERQILRTNQSTNSVFYLYTGIAFVVSLRQNDPDLALLLFFVVTQGQLLHYEISGETR